MRIREARALGHAVWQDDLRRGALDELRSLVDEGLGGVTANPSTFEKAISGADYDDGLRDLVERGVRAPAELYETLALEDVRAACDLLRVTHDDTEGGDGFVSFEVSPLLARDTPGTIEEALRLWRRIGRRNAMIKVPGTPEGMPAIEELTARGVNVNVTLLFGIDAYRYAADAYLRGLERRDDPGGPRSVASFFLSRVDAAVDPLLSAAGDTELLGRTAIANAKLAYSVYQGVVGGPRWASLAARGARPQRLLWASTGVKNPAYPKLMYVEALIGRDTVDTMPPEVLREFRRSGRVAETLPGGLEEARRVLEALARRDINLAELCDVLLQKGIDLFADAHEKLLRGLAARVRD